MGLTKVEDGIPKEDWYEFISKGVSIRDMEKVIKPCPKCGSTDIFLTEYEGAETVFDYRGSFTRAVICRKCGHRTGAYRTMGYAFVAWQEGRR